MTQENIVYIILVSTFAYILYVIVKKFRTKKASHCNNCSGCSQKR